MSSDRGTRQGDLVPLSRRPDFDDKAEDEVIDEDQEERYGQPIEGWDDDEESPQ